MRERHSERARERESLPLTSKFISCCQSNIQDIDKEREFKRFAKEQRQAASDKRKAILSAERERRAQVKAAKEKRQKAAEVTQVISAKTAKRMLKNKKQRKLVKTAAA